MYMMYRYVMRVWSRRQSLTKLKEGACAGLIEIAMTITKLLVFSYVLHSIIMAQKWVIIKNEDFVWLRFTFVAWVSEIKNPINLPYVIQIPASKDFERYKILRVSFPIVLHYFIPVLCKRAFGWLWQRTSNGSSRMWLKTRETIILCAHWDSWIT